MARHGPEQRAVRAGDGRIGIAMKNIKLIICLILILTLVLNIISCAQPEKPADEISQPQPEEIEPVTEPEPEPPVILDADGLYDMIMANKFIWERENMMGGTLIDLDFDGVPEFILMNGMSGHASMTVFKISGETGEKLEEIKHIDNLYVPENVFYEFRAILPYTDENGVKSWVVPYIKYTGGWDSDELYAEYFLSAFDFTGDNISETVKFSSVINYKYPERDKYYGYEYLDAKFYIDGAEHTASQQKLDEFLSELNRLVAEAEKSQEEHGDLGYLPWHCGGYYPNPSQAEWEDKKTEFLNGLLAVEPAYNLIPGIDSSYLWYGMEESWSSEENIPASIKKMAEAYYSGDDAYFRTADLFYDNGGAMCKPVIYLYPAEPADISVRVDFPAGGYFTCTYPDYGAGWDVTAYPDGTVINKADGLEYSYLYWAGKGPSKWDFSSGFVVKGGDTAAFLREKLAYLGLTPREYNEFIVYWLPHMQNNKYNLIAFQTAAYEEAARLRVSPEPDSVLRVFMAYTPLDNKIYIPEQELEQFERAGFSVIEWGGTCVN